MEKVRCEPPELAPYQERDIRDDVFYFVMPDRFSNDTPANDYGDLGGDKYTHGFGPTDKAFYHGMSTATRTLRVDSRYPETVTLDYPNLNRIVPIVAIDQGVFAEPVYLRGTLTDWNEGLRLAHLGNNRYELILKGLAAGEYEFKFADSDWADVNLGYGDVTFSDDSTGVTNPGNGNIGLSVPATNDYTFVLDASDPANPILSVTSSEVPPYQAQGALYLKGELNGWANSPAYQFTYLGGGQYRTTVGIDPASFDYSGDDASAIDFAIANAGWGFKLAGAGDLLTAGSSVTLSDTVGSNNRLDASLSPLPGGNLLPPTSATASIFNKRTSEPLKFQTPSQTRRSAVDADTGRPALSVSAGAGPQVVGKAAIALACQGIHLLSKTPLLFSV